MLTLTLGKRPGLTKSEAETARPGLKRLQTNSLVQIIYWVSRGNLRIWKLWTITYIFIDYKSISIMVWLTKTVGQEVNSEIRNSVELSRFWAMSKVSLSSFCLCTVMSIQFILVEKFLGKGLRGTGRLFPSLFWIHFWRVHRGIITNYKFFLRNW